MLPPRALLPRNTFIGSNQRRSHLGSAHSHAIQLIQIENDFDGFIVFLGEHTDAGVECA